MSSLLIWYVAFTHTHRHTHAKTSQTLCAYLPFQENGINTARQPTKRPEKYIPCLLSYTIGGKIRIHLQPFAWVPVHQTANGNVTLHFKERVVVTTLSFTGQLSASLFLAVCVCDLSLSSSHNAPDLCASFSTINRAGTPEISNCIHSFSAPRQGEADTDREEGRRGREGGKDGARQSGPRGNAGESRGGIRGRWKSMRGRKGRKGSSPRHYGWDTIRATGCPLIIIKTHKQRQSEGSILRVMPMYCIYMQLKEGRIKLQHFRPSK